MAQNAAIVINNGALTPVAKTFNMEVPGIPSGHYTWAEKSSGIYNQFRRLWTQVSVASAQRLTNRLDFGVTVPLVRTVNSVPAVTGTIRITTQAVYPADATQDEINDSFAFHSNGMANSLIKGQMRDLDFIS